MKRKSSSEEGSQMSAVSAIAARRAKAQAQAQTQTQTQVLTSRGIGGASTEEPPLKKARSSSSKTSRNTRSKQDKVASPQVQRQEDASEASSSVTSDDEDGGVSIVGVESEAQDDAWDGLENSAFNEGGSIPPAPKPIVESQNFLLSRTKLKRTDIVYATANCVCVRLKLRSTLAVIGQYDLWVKRGVISISGAKLHPSPRLHRVYAPSTHSLPIIKTVSASEYAEIELRSIVDGPYGLENLSPLFDRIKNSTDLPEGHPMRKHGPYTFSILHSSSEDAFGRSLRPLHMDKKWSRAIQDLSKRPGTLKVLACGPKGTGKSTFNTFLVNHLLSPPPSARLSDNGGDGVAFLDLDPGQPEFSPMGHIYLAHLRQPVLGPPFTHPDGGSYRGEPIIKKAAFIGSNSPKDDPDYYVAATMDLVEHYRILLQSYPRCPLVVNYPGWIFGLGLEIATLFIRSLGLTDLVYMSEKGPAEVVQPLSYVAQEFNIRMTILPSQPTNYVARSSSQLRTMQMLSYFHMSQDDYGSNTWSTDPLIQRRPFVVSYAGEDKGIVGVMVTGSGHDMDFLKELLEGSIVGVVAVEDTNPLFSGAGTVSPETRGEDFETEATSQDGNNTTTKQEPSTSIRLNKDSIPYILAGDHSNGGLDPSTSRSLGLAIIHSINTEQNSFTLYTPIPLTTVRTVIEQGHHIALVKGQIDSPHWAISEGYFAARTAQLKHRQAMALAKETNSGAGGEVTHHDLSIKSMMLRDQVRLAGHVPWMNVSMNDAAGDAKEAEGRVKMFRLRKKTNGAVESDAEW